MHIDINDPSEYHSVRWGTDENGNILPETYMYFKSNGDIYDYKGDFVCNASDYGIAMP